MPKTKKELNEQEIRTAYITPALNKRGWVVPDNMREEFVVTLGGVFLVGKTHSRKPGKRADYLLLNGDMPIAVVEAKDNNHTVSDGIQQAMDYAHLLDVKFAYSSNGEAFQEHDFITGKETLIKIDNFPTEDELYKRFLNTKHYTPEQQKVIETPYYHDADTWDPRFYQQLAIDRTVEAVAYGKKRVLLVMATGTGKTYTAFQIIHRLRKSGKAKKILYLADRDVLISQTMAQDFKPFKKIMTRIESVAEGELKIDPSYEVYMALYQQLVGKNGKPDAFREVKPEFFDLIIVDECHRGSAKADSEWRRILEYFSSATQIGMTATPKESDGVDTVGYFGEPVYRYSLREGIRDGFLAPYRVTSCFINVDLFGYQPEPDEIDLLGKEVTDKLYMRKDIGREIAIVQRRKLVAHRITRKLKEIGRMTKTIVFCPDIEEAAELRTLLVNMNADLVAKYPDYVTRIVGEDRPGKKLLSSFIDVNEPTPVIVTTSELLATGVDCKTCGLIVIDKEIGSMTEFKQIIGRGTRIREDKGKMHLEILDFRNATAKFKDPDFDGDPLPPDPDVDPVKPPKPPVPPTPPIDPPKPGRVKFIVEGHEVIIEKEIVSVLGEDGKTLHTESVEAYARSRIRRHFETLDSFIQKWTAAERKLAIMDELKEYSILVDAVREENPALREADIFDVICHVAFDQKPLTRRERALNVKKRNYFGKYGEEARRVMEALLDKYAENGILDFEKANILDIPPFTEIGKPTKIVRLFGGLPEFQQAIRELKTEIYKTEAL